MRGMTQRRYQRIQQMLRRRQPDLTLIAEEVHKPHNLSAILRSADAVGVERVHATHPTGGLPTYSATSASAERWVELLVHPDLSTAIAHVRAGGAQLLAAHFAPEALDFRAVDYTRPTCILFGNERDGVSEDAAAAADACIIIPMLGMVPSLNVSVASALVLFEAQRQRLAAGMYDTPRLPAHEIAARTTRALYPRESERLERAGLPLPPLGPDGALDAATVALLAHLPGGVDGERNGAPHSSREAAARLA
jgi:tRNA (guanosine-2'-O-)-methyltransferase